MPRNSKPKDTLTLRVSEAMQPDVGYGRARLDSHSKEALGLVPGDIVEIINATEKKSTAAVFWKAHQEDEGRGLVRIDGLVRRNLKISLGDKVEIAKADVKNAKKVILAPILERQISFAPGIDQIVKNRLLKRPVKRDDIVIVPGIALYSEAFPFAVINTAPEGIVMITEETQIVVKEESVKESELGAARVTYEDVGGLKNELQKVREMIELPLKHPELFARLGIDPPKGVLLFGPPGTGKTLIARAVANESGANFYSIQGPEIMSKWYGQSEENLRKTFEEAEKNAPSIIFIDELDSIAPKRADTSGEVERRVVAQMLTLMDGLKGRDKVIVIGATNRENSIDQALRRPGRFDREIEIGVPDKDGRKEVMQIHTRTMPLTEDVEVDKLAAQTHGFVGADLAALAREAAMRSLRRHLPEIDLDQPIPPEILDKMEVTMEDFRLALRDIEPSALREVVVEVPNVMWDDVGGLEDVKQQMREAVEWPLKFPESFEKMGIDPPKGVLLFGPPGTGKTLLAKAVATESEANFISIKGPEVLSKWVGESEKAIREIFKKAKQTSPTVVFFDEIDSLAPVRGSHSGDSGVSERIVNQLLTSMDGLESLEGVIVIGATNRPDILDPGLLRAGRFDRIILAPAPDKSARQQILEIHTKDMPLEGVSLEELANKTEGFVGADLEALCREAAILALRDDMGATVVTEHHFETALSKMRASVTKETMEYYQKVAERFTGGELVKRREKSYDSTYR